MADDVDNLGHEVEGYRALRPDCPTCEGTETVGCHVCGNRTDGHTCGPEACPDCTDGKMPLDKWVALLVETLASLRLRHPDHCRASFGRMHRCTCGTAEEQDAIIAVLKMVPK